MSGVYSKCWQEGCECAAQFAPKICVPAIGWPQDESRSLQAILGIRLCLAHCAIFSATEQFTAKETGNMWRNIFLMMAQASGSKIPPDFKRAWIKPVPLDSNEFLTFERIQSQHDARPSH